MPVKQLSDLVSLSKRRGFVFQSSEIYGGLSSCWDYGPLGVQLKRNVKEFWWKTMTRQKDIEGLDASILMHPKVWKASGHVDGFSDPLVDCKDCKARFREDLADGACPSCGSKNLTESRQFNLMFKTTLGPVDDGGQDDSSTVYLRPETAQGIFVNFLNVQGALRQKVPFGIAQIGKSFRNEVTVGHFIFRTCEFEQMEMQFFVKPGTDDQWFEQWKTKRLDFYKALEFNEENLRMVPHGPKDLAHYAKAAVDIEYKFPMGWSEVEGVHNRSDFDLSQHQKFSGKKLEYFDPQDNTHYLPFVIETAAGCDRLTLALLCEAYDEEELEGGQQRQVLRFPFSIAPIKVAILPLSKKEELKKIAEPLFESLSSHMNVDYDEAGSIGKRYRRQDEIGTPYCITVDFDSLEDQSVTLRDRDSMKQIRIPIAELSEKAALLGGLYKPFEQ